MPKDVAESVPDRSSSQEESLLESERTGQLRAAVALLPLMQRRCFELRAKGLKLREIAKTLGIAVPRVADQVQRAVRRLQSHVMAEHD